LGTGFVIDGSGLILTNNHVVANADEIKISFTEDPTEKPTDAKVVGRDPDLDVALIRVNTSRKLSPLKLGDSDALEVGEWVAAVGNPFGQGHSLTHGVISAKGRASPDFPLASYMQTDAPINPGNSGGPLVNTNGEVVGINSAIDARAQGIGFAIPINLVKKVLPQLETKGKVARGYLGVSIGSLTPDLAEQVGVAKDTQAAVVSHVYPGSPAARAGIEPYDVILEAGGKPVRSAGDLTTQVAGLEVGSSLPVKISREGHVKSLNIKLGERPTT
jgi:serine protease Do